MISQKGIQRQTKCFVWLFHKIWECEHFSTFITPTFLYKNANGSNQSQSTWLLNMIVDLTLLCKKLVQSSIFLATSFTWKMPENSDSMYSSIFMSEKIYHNFTCSGLDSWEIVNFVPIYFGSLGAHNWILVNLVHFR